MTVIFLLKLRSMHSCFLLEYLPIEGMTPTIQKSLFVFYLWNPRSSSNVFNKYSLNLSSGIAFMHHGFLISAVEGLGKIQNFPHFQLLPKMLYCQLDPYRIDGGHLLHILTPWLTILSIALLLFFFNGFDANTSKRFQLHPILSLLTI